MLRNLKQLNNLPSFPIFSCTKNTGPGESRLTIQARIGSSQLRTHRITIVEIRRLNGILTIGIVMENAWWPGKVACCGKQPMTPVVRLLLYGTKIEYSKSDGLFRYLQLSSDHRRCLLVSRRRSPAGGREAGIGDADP